MTLTAHVDLDAFKYSCAAVGEERSILVVHKETGWEKEFKTRTEFWGHHKKKAGGWLAQLNEKRVEKGKEPSKPEDFEIFDRQKIKDEPIANIFHTVKQSVESAVKASGADRAEFYIGKEDSFRVEQSTLLKYKGNRENMTKPLLLDDVVEYMTRKFDAHIVHNYEVDDVVTMNTYRKKGHFIICEDKDMWGCGGDTFNFNKPERGIVKTDCFGKLWIEEKVNKRGQTEKSVHGYGRMFKIFQACSADDSDNYRANCVSHTPWGEISAYNALAQCRNDKELFEAAIAVFKNLYPEPKTVTGWRGDEIAINWLYVMQECFNMCHMLRWKGDVVNLVEVFDRLKIEV